MAHVSLTLSMAGEYLVSAFSEMMDAPRFRACVWAKMKLEERCRLYALRMQALYGDAPAPSCNPKPEAPRCMKAAGAVVDGRTPVAASGASKISSTPNSAPASAEETSKRAKGGREVAGEKDLTPTSMATVAAPPPAPPRWFDIAGRSRYNAWVALRGRMAPDVAAECFCAEFLGLLRKYPHPTLLPPVEAALSTAQGLSFRSRSNGRTPIAGRSAAPASPHETVILRVRALQGDPAALALFWICRAYRLPCEFIIEPASSAFGGGCAAPATGGTAAVMPHETGTESSSPSRPSSTRSTTSPLPYTLADACFPFTVSLTHPVDAVHTAGAARPSSATTTVTSPEAAFVLLADTFLSASPHWMGVPSDKASASAAAAAQLVQRCTWIDELQQITRHLRTPILALMVHQSTLSASPSADDAFGRANLLHAVAAHLHCYEQWTMDRVLTRRLRQAHEVLQSVMASTAVEDCLRRAYAPDAKVVSAADVYVSSCGYALCTHPYCADVFPLLRVPVTSDGATGLQETVSARWPSFARRPSSETAIPTPAAASLNSGAHLPWALPLHLSGVPAEHNDIINRVLRRETMVSVRQERHQQPVRLFIDDTFADVDVDERARSSDKRRTARATNAQQQPMPSNHSKGHYDISECCSAKVAAEAVGQLIMARMSSLRTDDLSRDSRVGSTSSVSGVPFLVLREVFALTWSLCQEQVPAFPYFMLDGNPAQGGGFSFVAEVVLSNALVRRSPSSPAMVTTQTTSEEAHPQFPAALMPASAGVSAGGTRHGAVLLPTLVNGDTPVTSASSRDGGLSLESRLSSSWQAVRQTITESVSWLSGGHRSDDETSKKSSGANVGAPTTRVLRILGRSSSSTDANGAATPTTMLSQL